MLEAPRGMKSALERDEAFFCHEFMAEINQVRLSDVI